MENKSCESCQKMAAIYNKMAEKLRQRELEIEALKARIENYEGEAYRELEKLKKELKNEK